jgi:hypothetical protein
MTEDTPLPFDLPAVDRKKITVDFAGGNQSSVGGLLLLRQSEAQLGVCQRITNAMPDHRDQSRIEHQVSEAVGSTGPGVSDACGDRDGKGAAREEMTRWGRISRIAVGPLQDNCLGLASMNSIADTANLLKSSNNTRTNQVSRAK